MFDNRSKPYLIISLLFLPVVLFNSCTREQSTVTDQALMSTEDFYLPWQQLGPLYRDVMMAGVFSDSKTFSDCTPKTDPELILERYLEVKDDPDFELAAFVDEYFALPDQPEAVEVDTGVPMIEHLNNHWDNLTRQSDDSRTYSTLIPLPNKYVVPGGRFREIYYWDSYFTMIGLGVSGRIDLIESMLDNFAYQINTIGFIPNGNRTYYLGRSQPPFFAQMVKLYGSYVGMEKAAEKYLDEVRKEYDFWMDGADQLTGTQTEYRRVVKYGGFVLNRY